MHKNYCKSLVITAFLIICFITTPSPTLSNFESWLGPLISFLEHKYQYPAVNEIF